MPDFQKISQMIRKGTRERYVIVEEGEPAWVVLSMKDYENLVRGKEESAAGRKEKRIQEVEEMLSSYREETEKEEEGLGEDLGLGEVREPEFYFESIEEGREKMGMESGDLSTGREEKGQMQFDEIPF